VALLDSQSFGAISSGVSDLFVSFGYQAEAQGEAFEQPELRTGGRAVRPGSN